ncbi:MAG: CARDB domain-containing protein [Lachnospiraceae bacterium]
MRRIVRGLCMALCCMMLGGTAITAHAVSGNAVETADNASNETRSKYYAQLINFKNNLYIINTVSPEAKAKIDKLYASANTYIANNKLTEVEIASYVGTIQSQMSAIVSADTSIKPTTTKEFLAVGDTVATPEAQYGKEVAIILPIINLGEENITNIVVTPTTSPLVAEWPFELDKTSYSQVVEDLPGNKNKEDATKNRREVGYYFKTRADVLNGYYKLEYTLTYTVNNTIETTKLTTYVHTIGAPGSGNIDQGKDTTTKASTPRIVVTGFETTPAVVNAGDTFMLNVHVKNTSKRTAVSNVEFDLEAAQEGKDETAVYSAFLPTSGSNTVYIEQIPIEGTAVLSIEMTAKVDLAQKPYVLNIKMHYEDDKYNPYDATTSVSIPVKQEAKFDTSTPEIMPTSIMVGEQSNIMFSVYNTGKTTLYNLQVKFVDDSITGGNTFVGKVEPGATGNVDAMVTGQAASIGEGTVKAIITYEDAAGKITESEKEINLFVSESTQNDMDMNGDMGEEPTDQNASKKGLFITIGIIVAAIVVLILIVSLLKRKKKKKENKELAADLLDLDEIEVTDEKGE